MKFRVELVGIFFFSFLAASGNIAKKTLTYFCGGKSYFKPFCVVYFLNQRVSTLTALEILRNSTFPKEEKYKNAKTDHVIIR